MKRVMTAAPALAAAALGALLLGFDAYVLWGNETNHTGLPISWLELLYGACTVCAVGLVNATRRGTPGRRLAWWLLVIGLAGVANLLALERLDVMLEYEDWARKGMPDRPRWR